MLLRAETILPQSNNSSHVDISYIMGTKRADTIIEILIGILIVILTRILTEIETDRILTESHKNADRIMTEECKKY